MTGAIRDTIRRTLENRLGYRFQSPELLAQALTHRSFGLSRSYLSFYRN